MRQGLTTDSPSSRQGVWCIRISKRLVIKVVSRCQNASEQAAVKQQRILQTQLHTEFMQIIQFDFDQNHLNHDLWRLSIQAFHEFHDLFKVTWRRTDDQRVAYRFGNDDDFRFNLCEWILPSRSCLIDDSFTAQKIVDGVGDVQSGRILQSIDFVHSFL